MYACQVIINIDIKEQHNLYDNPASKIEETFRYNNVLWSNCSINRFASQHAQYDIIIYFILTEHCLINLILTEMWILMIVLRVWELYLGINMKGGN